MSNEDDLSASLTLRRGAASGVGAERIAVLQAIEELGSISAAAKKVGLSYKGAWDAVQALNNLFDAPLVKAAPGGRSGGAAEVTERGRAMIAAFLRVQDEIDAAMARLADNFASEGFSFWSLGMRTSARNALRGRIADVKRGAVNGEVKLRVGDGVEIISILAEQSIDELALEDGKSAIALIESSFVLLAKGDDFRTSARNRLSGTVVSRRDGVVSSEIVVGIAEGKSLVSMIPLQSARDLEIQEGDAISALIKAPHVILAVE